MTVKALEPGGVSPRGVSQVWGNLPRGLFLQLLKCLPPKGQDPSPLVLFFVLYMLAFVSNPF